MPVSNDPWTTRWLGSVWRALVYLFCLSSFLGSLWGSFLGSHYPRNYPNRIHCFAGLAYFNTSQCSPFCGPTYFNLLPSTNLAVSFSIPLTVISSPSATFASDHSGLAFNNVRIRSGVYTEPFTEPFTELFTEPFHFRMNSRSVLPVACLRLYHEDGCSTNWNITTPFRLLRI